LTSFVVEQDNVFQIPDPKPIPTNVLKTIPAGVYTLNDMLGQYYLTKSDKFKTPKTYGRITRIATRVIATYKDRNTNTGVLLSGQKGSGKTLTAKLIVSTLLTEGMPTILINQPYCGDAFNNFLQNITQRCVIFFDEIEKVYDTDAQKKLLTLLDGVYQSNKLFLLTSNQSNSSYLDSNLINRPSRIYYHIPFDGVDEETIVGYCQDVLEDKNKIDDICNVAYTLGNINFDMLKAIVEDTNRYKCNPFEVLEYLNIDQNSQYRNYKLKLQVSDNIVSISPIYSVARVFPFGSHNFEIKYKTKDIENSPYSIVEFNQNDLKSYSRKQGLLFYEKMHNRKLHKVTATLTATTPVKSPSEYEALKDSEEVE
jgi:SpoVK/Ycf46/Vps4 family AAA+-type ATPase